MDAKDYLISAARQHQHNDCSGLIPAYEYDETNKLVDRLLVENESFRRKQWELRSKLNDAISLLIRYRKEVPIGNQPHMICHMVDKALKANGIGGE